MGCFRDVRREQGSIDNLHMLELSCAVDGCWLAARCCDAAAVLMLVELSWRLEPRGWIWRRRKSDILVQAIPYGRRGRGRERERHMVIGR
eukprot:scaffold34948_cov74-Cyclotella_meneghiniana.AAC.3